MARFKKIYIEISDICGLHCSFCPNPKNVRKTMDLELFESTCSQSAGLTELISLHILGDPCALENLKDYLNIAQKYDLKVDLVTSGIYLKPSDFMALTSSPIHQIAISLNAGFDKNNRSFVAKDYLQNILNFCDYKIANDTQNFVNLRLQEISLNELSNVRDMILARFNVLTDKIDTARDGQFRYKLTKRVFLNITRTFEWARIRLDRDGHKEKYCYGLVSQIGILADGSVVPCCIDTKAILKLGNLKSQSLQEILKSKRASEIYEGFMQGRAIEKLCQHCNYLVKN